MTPRVLIITSDFYVGDSLKQVIEQTFGDQVSVHGLYRVYHVPEELLPNDIVISDGSCKDHDGSRSYPVHFDASPYVQKSNATLISFARPGINQPKRTLVDRLLQRPESSAHPHIPTEKDMQEKILAEVHAHLN